MLLEICRTVFTMETTNAKNPIELIDWAGRHCLPPSSGMKTSGASLTLQLKICSINKKQMLEKTLRWSSVSEIQGGIQGGRFEDVEMEIGPVDIYRHISFTNTYLPFPCDTGMVEQTVLPF